MQDSNPIFQGREIVIHEITEHETVFFSFVDELEEEREALLGSIEQG